MGLNRLDKQTNTSMGDKRQVGRLYIVTNVNGKKIGTNGRISSPNTAFPASFERKPWFGKTKQRWKDQDNLQDQVLTGLNVPKAFHDVKGDDDDDDDNDGKCDILLLRKTDYWCKI